MFNNVHNSILEKSFSIFSYFLFGSMFFFYALSDFVIIFLLWIILKADTFNFFFKNYKNLIQNEQIDIIKKIQIK